MNKQKIRKLIGMILAIITIAIMSTVFMDIKTVDDCCDLGKDTVFKKWRCYGTLVISDQDCID